MTLDLDEHKAVEQILAIASKALGASTGMTGVPRLEAEIEQFLAAGNSIDDVLAAVIRVGERLGLIKRDASGQFEPRKTSKTLAKEEQVEEQAEASETREAEAKAAATQKSEENEPDEESAERTRKNKTSIFAKAFAYRLGDGRRLGDLYHSELYTVSGKLARDAKLLIAVANRSKPVTDTRVKDYFNAKELHGMLEKAKADAKAKNKADAKAKKARRSKAAKAEVVL